MLLGEFTLDGAGALNTLKAMDQKFSGLLSTVAKFGAIAGGSFAAFGAVNQVIQSFGESLDMGSRFKSMSNATGETVHDLVILEKALRGVDAQTFLFKLQTAFSGVNEEGKNTAAALKNLHLSAQQLRSLPALDQIKLLQQGLAGVKNQADKVAIVKDLFGFRFAASALPLLTNADALDKAKQRAEPLAAALDKNADNFKALGAAIGGVKDNLKEFFVGALEGVAPTATDIASAIANINFVEIGRAVGSLANIFLQLGRVFIYLAPIVDHIGAALAKLHQSAFIGAAIGGAIGLATGGPLGALAGLLGGGLAGQVFGDITGHTGDKKTEGFADAFRGLRDPGTDSGFKEAPVSALQKVGGGGGFGGGDPLLTESRQQTNILRQIAANTGRSLGVSGAGGTWDPVPV